MHSSRKGRRCSATAIAALAVLGCGESGDRVREQPHTATASQAAPASPSHEDELNDDAAHAVSGDRDCDGVTDVDDPNIEQQPDRDGDRWGDRCDRAPDDALHH